MKSFQGACNWGAAIGIFFMGFCLGGVTEYSGERAVRRFAKVRQYRCEFFFGGGSVEHFQWEMSMKNCKSHGKW